MKVWLQINPPEESYFSVSTPEPRPVRYTSFADETAIPFAALPPLLDVTDH